MSRATPLHVAAGSNNTAVLDEALLLPPKEQQAALSASDAGRNTPLHIAAYKGHLEFVSKIVSSCTMSHYAHELSNIINDNGDSPLHLAVLGNHLPVVRALLTASPPSNVHLKDKQGYTPMHYACGEGYLDIVQVRVRPPSASGAHADAACDAVALLAGVDVCGDERGGLDTAHVQLPARPRRRRALHHREGPPVRVLLQLRRRHRAALRRSRDLPPTRTRLVLCRPPLTRVQASVRQVALH
jgi:ankyrin repeat protein